METHLWPILFYEQGLSFKQIDLLNFANTSKEHYDLILSREKSKETNKMNGFFKFINFPEMIDKNKYASCSGFYDLKLKKIKDCVKIYQQLCRLDDENKIVLKSALKTSPQYPEFASVINHLITEREIEERIKTTLQVLDPINRVTLKSRKSYLEKSLQILLSCEQGAINSLYFEKHREDFNINEIPRPEIYASIYSPVLTTFEKSILMRDVFEKTIANIWSFGKIEVAIQQFSCIGKSDNAAMIFFEATLRDLLRQHSIIYMNNFHFAFLLPKTLTLLGLNENNVKCTYDKARQDFLDEKINDKINQHLEIYNFKKAYSLSRYIISPYAYRKILKKINTQKIDWLLSKQEFENAIGFIRSMDNFKYRNIYLKKVAFHAIKHEQYDIALSATSQFFDIPFRDFFFFEIATKQKLSKGYNAFLCIKNIENYLDKFHSHILENIELSDLSKTLEFVIDPEIAKLKTQILPCIAKKLFHDKNVIQWLEFSNQIQKDLTKLYFLKHLFSGLKHDKSDFFNESNPTCSLLLGTLEKNDFDTIKSICGTSNKWEQILILYFIANHFLPKKNLSRWIKNVSKIHKDKVRQQFIESFLIGMETLQLHRSPVPFVDKLLETYDISTALDVINAYPIPVTQSKLFMTLFNKCHFDGEKEPLLRHICKTVRDPLERRQEILKLLGY